jgi:hypothetical protein
MQVEVSVTEELGSNTQSAHEAWRENARGLEQIYDIIIPDQETQVAAEPAFRPLEKRPALLLRLSGSVLIANARNLTIGCSLVGLLPFRSGFLGLLGFAVRSHLPLGHANFHSCLQGSTL